MCHHPANTNDQMKPEGCDPAVSSETKPAGSGKSLEVITQQGRQDVSIPTEPHVSGSPTASLTSSSGCSFSSTSGDLSRDLSSNGRDDQGYKRSKSDPDDLRDGQIGHLKKSCSLASVNDHDKFDGSFNVYQLREDGNAQAKYKPEDSSNAYLDEETETLMFDGSTNPDIWKPPPAENEDSLTMFVEEDDDEECADGEKWAKSGSFCSFEEDISKSCQFKEDKDKAREEIKNGRFRNLVTQLLKTVGIDDLEKEDQCWVDIVSSLAWSAALILKPDATEGKAMDPAGYLKVKCIETGSRSQSELFKGLVFKKHAAHKHMPIKHTKPRLMLFEGMLGHSSGLSSFNSMITQDKENTGQTDDMAEDVKSLLEKLEACRANVVLLEKSAPRELLEHLLKMEATLVVDMKLHRLERIARCIGSPIWCAENMHNLQLKQCDMLYFEKFDEEHAQLGEGGKMPRKTLMFLEGSPAHLGCTILLKGSHREELKKIKSVVQCAVVMAYHFILETSFLMDQEVMFSTITSGGGSGRAGEDFTGIDSGVSCNEEVGDNSSEKTVLSSEEYPLAGTDGSLSHEKDVPCGSALANGTHVPINRVYEHVSTAWPSHGSDVPRRLHTDGSHKLSSESMYEDVVQDVMETLVSPADQYMQPYLQISDRDPNAQVADPVSVLPATEVNEHHGTESNAEKSTVADNSRQLLSSSTGTNSDSRTTGSDSDDHNGKKDKIGAVLDSESILVLLSSRNASSGAICEQNNFSRIKFYKDVDVPLGKFLKEKVLSTLVRCNTCHKPPEDHFYYFAHNNKQLTIRVKQIQGEPLPGEVNKKLWMWSRCGKCKPDKEGIKNTTKRVLMSGAARALSFGKFLELSFSNHSSLNRLSDCGHSLHRDFLYFFGLGNMVSMFRYSPVVRYAVSVPPLKLDFNGTIKEDWLQKEAENVYAKAMSFFTEVSGYLKEIRTSRFSGLTLNINGSIQEFTDIENILAVEKFEFEENIKKTCTDSGQSVLKLLCLNRIRWELYLEACVWNRRLRLLLSPVHASAYTAPIDKTVEDKSNDGESQSPAPDVGASVVTDVKDHNPSEDCACAEMQSDPAEELGKRSLSASKSFSDMAAFRQLSKCESFRGEWVWDSFSQIRGDCIKDLHGQDFFRFDPHHSPDRLPTVSQIITEEGSRLFIPLSDDYFVSDHEGEISSIIACNLASKKDTETLIDDDSDSHSEDKTPRSSDESNTLLRSVSEPHPFSGESDVGHLAPTMSLAESRFSSFDGLNLLANLASSEPYAAKAKHSVVSLYESEFRALRNMCCPSELEYIASLSRCKNWDAKGGKSKSFFAKTLDDRLIIKEIKKTELESFVKFASEYFDYMNQSFESGNQTCLAKILGIYQVTVRHSKSGKETKHALMVMENLSFGRNISRQYDLKGALHARYTANADASGDVLLDQNFVDDMNLSPLYVGQKAKRLLQRAVWNDTAFLTSINVMDYSLLVGVDKERRELVCGVIDYLRQYTWDKQLETWVKSSLVVPKNFLPTIISPKEYKKRFRGFMGTRFLTVPDQWCSQRSSNPCKLCGEPDESKANNPEQPNKPFHAP